jgi:type III restriction enzyme
VTFELLPFQARASSQMAQRFLLLVQDDDRPWEKRNWATPYYQALSAITGCGKTVMLADSVAQIRAVMSDEPIVLWISKSKAVVEQTSANFAAGGKYEGLLEGFLATQLSELDPDRIFDNTQPLLVFATVGAFNQVDKADGTLKVHKTSADKAEDSLWTMLGNRKRSDEQERRPLLVVYDEAHNLTDQQTELLLELQPSAILVASATMSTPGRLGRAIDRLKEHGWSETIPDEPEGASHKGLVTSIRSKAAVDAGLVKRQIVLGGYAAEMQSTLDDMLADYATVAEKASALQAGFVPKAIYVCRTNISIEDGSVDIPTRPFVERKAPPILIWRYLVEQKQVDPKDIAVYCDLKIDRKHHPAPEDFNLFSGGDDDFAVFSAGDYKHIIFNLSLQEGWDDPSCCFAYIDKAMGSQLQIEQVIGRVLRQPGARHYSDPDLNTANFYIRIDSKQEFPRILDLVSKKIAAEMPEVRLDGFSDSRDRKRSRLEPKVPLYVPEIHINSDEAVEPLQQLIDQINDYTHAPASQVEGKGDLELAYQRIGDGSKPTISSEKREHSNRVVARWLIRRTMQSLYPEAVKTIDWSDTRFDARIEVTSTAAVDMRDKADKLVDIFLAHSDLAFEDSNVYTVGPVLTKPDNLAKYVNAGHVGYSDLSPFEAPFADALDQTGLTWVRNPSNGGYSIPLLEKGSSRRFFPDFLVWKDDKIFAIDPKGDHLIVSDAGKKLLAIRDERGRQRVVVRLITAGKWSYDPVKKLSQDGVSVWRITGSGQVRCTHHSSIAEGVKKALTM